MGGVLKCVDYIKFKNATFPSIIKFKLIGYLKISGHVYSNQSLYQCHSDIFQDNKYDPLVPH